MHPAKGIVSDSIAGSALILAGGESRRFGEDKAFIAFSGTSLIEHIINQLKPYFPEIIISAKETEKFRHLNLPVCADKLPKAGPLGGIHAGLQTSKSPYLFVTACDMPYPSPGIIDYLKKYVQQCSPGSRPDAVVLCRDGFIEPLHGMYSKNSVQAMERFVKSGNSGIFSFLQTTEIKTVESSLINRLCPDRSLYLNINKKEDLIKINSLS